MSTNPSVTAIQGPAADRDALYPAAKQSAGELYFATDPGAPALYVLAIDASGGRAWVPVSLGVVPGLAPLGARGTFLNAGDGTTAAWVTLGLMPRAAALASAALPAYTADNVAGTLTANGNGALPQQNGVTSTVGEVIFVYQTAVTSGVHSGVYVVTQLGDAGSPWKLTRGNRLFTGAHAAGAFVYICEGLFPGYVFQCTNLQTADVVGTDALTWAVVSAPYNEATTFQFGSYTVDGFTRSFSHAAAGITVTLDMALPNGREINFWDVTNGLTPNTTFVTSTGQARITYYATPTILTASLNVNVPYSIRAKKIGGAWYLR